MPRVSASVPVAAMVVILGNSDLIRWWQHLIPSFSRRESSRRYVSVSVLGPVFNCLSCQVEGCVKTQFGQHLIWIRKRVYADGTDEPLP
mmetsp:Transcript_9688/g.27854  ORF Transcript_9688/g.27854 Transcript_9688/m.27854 type:complete len:89 (+) Transcript_9688:293-559(+)